jgi:hypothetical protein
MSSTQMRRRVVAAGVIVIVVAVAAGGIAVGVATSDLFHQRWPSQENSLTADRDSALAELARNESPQELIATFRQLEVPARIRFPDGTVRQTVRRGADFVVMPKDFGGPVSAEVALSEGGSVEILPPPPEVFDSEVDQPVPAQLHAALGVALVAGLGMWLMLRWGLRPVERAVDAARGIEDLQERSRRFVADAAHQLNRPASSLQATTEAFVIARASSATQEQDRLVPILHDEATRMSRLASRLLLLARLDAHQPHARHDVDLVALVDHQLAQLREARPDLDITADLPSALTAHVDTEAVREAISNLLHNAQRYARHRVDLSLTPSESRAILRVADDGPGPEPDTQQGMFERFATFDDDGGTGLGLAIVRGVAQAHGGQASYQDGCFVLTIDTAANPTLMDRPTERQS